LLESQEPQDCSPVFLKQFGCCLDVFVYGKTPLDVGLEAQDLLVSLCRVMTVLPVLECALDLEIVSS
jgi:hypothetical protein